MAHGGYAKWRVAGRKTTAGTSRRPKGLRVEKKPKNSSLKNQIRSIGRMIRKKPNTSRVFLPAPMSRFASASRMYWNEIPSSSNTTQRRSQCSYAATSSHTSQSSNLSSNSDAHKPKRKRRPKTKKQQDSCLNGEEASNGFSLATTTALVLHATMVYNRYIDVIDDVVTNVKIYRFLLFLANEMNPKLFFT
ncbi:unnamed protein product [Thlaspi arvense]|uniref:Uncharacterized protein n=1 Tax=Thlaspi arvense TaxID=13288 RepID=A0AAU9RDY7_THLAR|nr:unnamed protein product [Thlaspi arvense]